VEFSLNAIFWAGIVLAVLLLVSRMIRQKTTIFRRIFLPSSIVAGSLALLLGPEVLPADLTPFPEWMVAVWAATPGLLINVVFAALLMGKPLPRLREIWHYAGPQVCFGQTVAWGQYVLGIGLTLLVLAPVFGVPAAAGALIEIGFEGGHGTAAGMGEAFEAAGWPEGQDLALGLATIGLVGGVLIGTVLINWAVRRGTIAPAAADGGAGVPDLELSSAELTDRDLEELRQERQRESQPTDPLSLHLGMVAVAIAIGWLLLEGLRWLELATWARGDDPVTVFTHVPLFPLAMIGGVIIQGVSDRIGTSHHISRRLMNRISGTALDFTIVAALGALSLQAIGENLGPFLILAGAGTAWSVLAVLFLAPRIIPYGWFERGIGDFGQSMGVTVTGLLLMRVADPPNRAGAMESFGYKQLLFEPIVGGGLFTGASVALLTAFGAPVMLAVTAAVMVFWIAFGLIAFGRQARENRAAGR
jgi:glutamate:Na+ symporter, ESS family